MMPAVYTVLALLPGRASGAVFVTDSSADMEVLGNQGNGDAPSSLQRARLVRRQMADADTSPLVQAADENIEREAIAKAVEAAGIMAASEVRFKAIKEEFEAEEKEVDKKRLDAEERVKALEIEKAKNAKQKSIQKEKPAPNVVPMAKDLLMEDARHKAMEEERKKLENVHRQIKAREGQEGKEKRKSHAKVSGLPGIAFSKDAYVLDKDIAYEKLLKRLALEKRSKADSEDDETETWCDRDYPLGHWNSSNCSRDGAGAHQLILDAEMCASAAREANATPHDHHFIIPEEWADMHPKGCFVFPCHWDAGHVCYWFNDIGDTPMYPWGAPVCQRPKFQNGTKDTNAGCPDGYDVILNENNCSEAGICQGFDLETDFIVGEGDFHNESQHNIYPEGCYIDDELGSVRFNPIYGTHPPQTPRGMPLCNVTMATHFPEMTLPWDVFWNG